MNLIQGIQLPELIMLILGFILGLALIFIFIYTALRSKPNLYLLFGFIAPAILIGYPSYKSSQFGNDVVKIEQLVEKVNEDPTNVEAQRALIDNLGQLPASRCKTSVDAMTTIANAQASLGLYDSARVTIQKAVDLDKTSPKAVESQKEIYKKWEARENIRAHVRYLDSNIKDIETRPNDKILRDSIAYHLESVEKLSMATAIHLENKQVITVARAAAIVGQKEQAEQITEEVLRINPQQKDAVKLKKDMDNKKFKPQVKQLPKVKVEIETKKENNKVDNVKVVPAPAPVYQDTPHLRLRLIPKTGIEFKKWNIKE